MAERIGKYTLSFTSKPSIAGSAAVVGKKEGEGPLGNEFDKIYTDTTMGECSWEKAESSIQREAIIRALAKSDTATSQVDAVIAGDLLNQCIGTTFGLREMNIPFAGVYGACSTMALSLLMGSIMVDSGAANTCVCATSSHFCSAERQFRYPLEYGGQRPPAAQWTVTGSGAAVLKKAGGKVRVEKGIIGRIQDLGIRDANNMGAAMAPAAASTITDFLKDTGTSPEDYDMILTGDLGSVGSKLLCELMVKESGIDISAVHRDCGVMIFDPEKQDVNAGGSGCGCSGAVVCSFIMRRLMEGELKKVLFVGTGALMSPTSSKQGESVPGIAHGVLLSTQ